MVPARHIGGFSPAEPEGLRIFALLAALIERQP
jgi:hypothetical protein